MKEALNFIKLRDRCLRILDKNKYISVATAIDNQVRVRTVDYANVELSIGFVTWKNTVKMEHIKRNALVSLCIDNLQIQGTATVSGHPPRVHTIGSEGLDLERNNRAGFTAD